MLHSRVALAGVLIAALAVLGLVAPQATVAGGFRLAPAAPAAVVAAVEVEPNDSCADAQALGEFVEPLALSGELDGRANVYPYPDPPEINLDFFRITAAPGTWLQIDLRGQASAGGTLADPLVGAFAGDCTWLSIDDDSGSGADASLRLPVPDDGVVVIGATSCCSGFELGGPGAGTYTLDVQEVVPADSVRGRVVSATTGDPIAGASTELQRCDGQNCMWLATALTGADGGFSFVHDFSPSYDPYPQPGDPVEALLFAGDYRVVVRQSGYFSLDGAIFPLGPGQAVDLDPLAMEPLRYGAAINGRLVDALSGAPLSGNDPDYAYVELIRCAEYDCYEPVGWAAPDANGFFSFTSQNTYPGLVVGTYQLSFAASQYKPGRSATFTIGVDATVDLGEVEIESAPLRVVGLEGCAGVPARGGVCRYAATIVNGQRQRANLQAWSVITAVAPQSYDAYSQFQPQSSQPIRLRSGQSRTVRFQVNVPAGVPVGTLFCANLYVAPDTGGFLFQAQLSRQIFCAAKQGDGSLRILDQKEARLLQERFRGTTGPR